MHDALYAHKTFLQHRFYNIGLTLEGLLVYTKYCINIRYFKKYILYNCVCGIKHFIYFLKSK